MAKVLLIGCGQLGTAIALALHHHGNEVVGVRKSSKLLPMDIRTIQADIFDDSTQSILASIQPDYIIYCLAATAQTDESYQQYYVDGLRKVIASQSNHSTLKHLFFVSSTRVFGQVSDKMLDENTPAIPSDFGGERLLEAENLLHECCLPSTIFRLSGIYGSERLYLLRMAKDFSKWPNENGWSNRIHQTDAAGFIAFMVQKAKSEQLLPLYIVTDNQPTKQYDVLIWLARKMDMVVDNVVVPAVIKGKQLSNGRLIETGYELKYPSYQTGYSEILSQLNE